WRFQKFTHRNFETPEGESFEILFPGNWNQLSGPDFKEARLYIAGIQRSPSLSSRKFYDEVSKTLKLILLN
ncbi:MAG: DUF2851 family protein, partial [Flavobacteriaceae bacterium]